MLPDDRWSPAMEIILTLDKDEAFDYLNELKESNVLHMSSAGSHLRDWFGIDAHEARHWLLEWIEEYQC